MQPAELNLSSLDERYGRLRVTDRRRETQLMASLDEHGQQDAIIVVAEAAGRYVVVDGHKRVRAMRRLRRDTVKAIVWEAGAAEALEPQPAQSPVTPPRAEAARSSRRVRRLGIWGEG